MLGCENYRMICYDKHRIINNGEWPQTGIKFEPDNMLKYV